MMKEKQAKLNKPKRPKGHRRKQALRITLLHLFEVIALVLALAMVVFGGIAWRLSKGPVPLENFREDAETALISTFGGKNASVSNLQMTWSKTERSLVISASDVRITGENGGQMLSIPRIEAGLSGLGLIQGKLQFSRLVTYGGEMSIVRRQDGALGFGPGSPEQVLSNARAWRRTSGVNAPVLRRAISKLQYIGIRGGHLRARDLRAGVSWYSNDANLKFSRQGNLLNLSGSGSVNSKGIGAKTETKGSFTVTGNSRADFSHMFVEVGLKNLVPAHFAPDTGPVAFARGFEFPVSTHLTIITGSNGLLNQLDWEAEAGSGILKLGERAEKLISANFHASYNATSGKVEILSGKIRGQHSRLSVSGFLQGVDPARLVVGETISFGLTAEPAQIDLKGWLPGVADFSRINMQGSFNTVARQLHFQSLGFQTGDLQFSGRGDVDWVKVAGREGLFPKIHVTGSSKGKASVGRVLSLWPLQSAEGARSWSAKNMRSGNISTLVLELNTNPDLIDQGGLSNDMLTLSFAFSDISTGYYGDMPPLRGMQGTAFLRGNRFDVKLEKGKLLDLVLSNGTVTIPYLHPTGAPATYAAHASGPLSSVLELLDHEPFGYARMYGIKPNLTGGSGELDMSIIRPMRVHVPFNKMKFAVNGDFKQVKIPALIFGQDLGQGDIQVQATQDGMQVTGNAQLGGQDAQFTWGENFKAGNQARTTLDIKTNLQVGLFDTLGLPSRGWFGGRAGLELRTKGNGLEVRQGMVQVDLRDADLSIPAFGWRKVAGTPGTLAFQLSETKAGNFALQDLDLQTQGLELQGSASFSDDQGLVSATLDRARVTDGFDLSAQISRGEKGNFLINADVREADISKLLRNATFGGDNLALPYHAKIKFGHVIAGQRLLLNDGSIVMDQQVRNGVNHIEELDMQASSAQGPLHFTISRPENGNRSVQRVLDAKAPDGGALLNALYGIDGIEGGKFTAHGTLSDESGTSDKVKLQLTDFRLQNTPVVAKILSLGSLTGFADTLAGSGMAFSELVVPMEMRPGEITIRRARATGPAMGVTMDGDIDLTKRTLLLEGSLAPAYTLNSILGYIPIMGDILVPREGEGVFGLTYSVEGPFSKMAVTVNPLSAFAPGVLRQMFGGKLPATKPKPEPQQKTPIVEPE